MLIRSLNPVVFNVVYKWYLAMLNALLKKVANQWCSHAALI